VKRFPSLLSEQVLPLSGSGIFQGFLFDSQQKRLGVKGLICRFDSMFFCETFQS